MSATTIQTGRLGYGVPIEAVSQLNLSNIVTQASASKAATVNAPAGIVTIAGSDAPATSATTYTITCPYVRTDSIILIEVLNGFTVSSAATTMVKTLATVAAGSFTVKLTAGGSIDGGSGAIQFVVINKA